MMAINAFLPYGYEKEASTSMRGSEEFITDELESVTIEASASMRGNEEFIIEPESVTIEESASMRVQDQSMMSPPERIVFQTDSFQCLDDHRKCLEGQTVGRIGCVIGLIICWAQGISFR